MTKCMWCGDNAIITYFPYCSKICKNEAEAEKEYQKQFLNDNYD